MMSITQNLAGETYKTAIDGETQSFRIVPQISSSLRLDLVFWQTYGEKSTVEGKN